MPPRIRTRASKALKENIDSDNKLKNIKSNAKPPRKPLADKTNSASDDTSVEIPQKTKADVRVRRDRRLPTRFEENLVLKNLSNKSKQNVNITPKINTKENVNITPKINTKVSPKPANISIVSINNTPAKNSEPESSPFKTPSKTETSLVVSRPRRICRLPSRFDDHSISPSKYIPIQPANASTPKQNNAKLANKENPSKKLKNVSVKQTLLQPIRSKRTAAVPEKKVQENVVPEKVSPDTNNNAKARSARAKKALSKPSPPKKLSPKLNNNSIRKFFNRTRSPQVSPVKKVSPKPTNAKKINANNLSFKVLGGKKTSKDNGKDDLDIYEFTFNPEEEPQPQKKKRKKPVVKKPKVTKPKATVTYKSTYDQNISKALSALKKVVKPSKATGSDKLPQIQEINDEEQEIAEENYVVTNNISTATNANTPAMNDTGKTSVHECNYASIRVEDIAADIEPSLDHCDDINYSPVNSPRPESPAPKCVSALKQTPGRPSLNKDPLNLQEELSFFDDVPVASSSMNMSVRHPLASPWRVEFGSLPIKWHSNTYVKPNMTPAVESSFICSEDSTKKKHVYTNMVPETNDSLPQLVSNTSNLKQTSIISFIKEVAERQAKKKRGRSVSPTKATAIFSNVEINMPNTAQEASSNKDPPTNKDTSEEVSACSNDFSNEKERPKETRKTRKRKNDENIDENIRPAKSPRKQQDKNCTYFGFDDSESIDQENVSPVKIKDVRGRSLRPRTRPALQEINGPTRAALPLAAKTKIITSSDAINRAYEELKSGADAPAFPEKNIEVNEPPTFNDDSQSVHLFEDIEVVHHLKPTRKSYGKAKKVTFCQPTASGSDSEEAVPHLNDTSFEDDLGDLTFEVPNVKEKKKSKKKPKRLMSKKEEKEAEEWAAGFNSMCEEVEEFPLVVE